MNEPKDHPVKPGQRSSRCLCEGGVHEGQAPIRICRLRFTGPTVLEYVNSPQFIRCEDSEHWLQAEIAQGRQSPGTYILVRELAHITIDTTLNGGSTMSAMYPTVTEEPHDKTH